MQLAFCSSCLLVVIIELNSCPINRFNGDTVTRCNKCACIVPQSDISGGECTSGSELQLPIDTSHP